LGALAERDEVDLTVSYLEAASPDSPWPDRALREWECILPGFWFPVGGARVHVNRPPPAASEFDVFVFNSAMSLTAQFSMRAMPRGARWIFWGERFTGQGRLHRLVAAPLARASAIAAIGSLAVRDYSGRFPGSRVANIPYHCDLRPFARARGRSGGEPTFLFCGQMIRRKGVDLLLEAFSQIGGGRLLLVGREADLPGFLEAVPSEVRARIEYAGFQAPEALPDFFARSDVFVLPSRHDGWGVVVNQALGAGLPLLCSDAVGAAHDLIEPGRNGLVVEAGSAGALAGAMKRMLDGPELVRKWGAASFEAAGAWSPEAGAERWCRLFEEVMAK
jgi:glycosyltransferase involved in cell wall biosynthesis